MSNSENFEARYAESIKHLRSMRLIDDEFMSVAFKDKRCAQSVLRAVLDKPSLVVRGVLTQVHVGFFNGRKVRFDIFAADDNGRQYNIEVQRLKSEASPKRLRFHSSLLDANVSQSATKFSELPETYVIFIVEGDLYGQGKAIYQIERVILGQQKLFGDEAHIMVVNSLIHDNTPLGRTMRDFYCENPQEIQDPDLRNRVSCLKLEEKGIKEMCSVFDKIRNEGRDEGKVEGILLGRKEGKNEGILIGRNEGKDEGIKIGQEQGKTATLYTLVQHGKLSALDAALMLQMNVDSFLNAMNKAGFQPPQARP